jgi:hypothetical protein
VVIPQAGLYDRKSEIRSTANLRDREILENSYKSNRGRHAESGNSRYSKVPANNISSTRDSYINKLMLNENVGPGSYNIYKSSLNKKHGAVFSTAPKNIE